MNTGSYGTVGLLLLIFFGAEQIGTILLLQVYPRIRGWSDNQTSQWTASFAIEFWLIAVCYLLVLLVLWRWFLKGRPELKKLVGLVRPRLSNIVWVVFGLFLFYVISALVIGLLTHFSPSLKANSELTQQLNVTAVHGPREILAGIIGLCIIDPITEELVFRGFIFANLKQRLPIVVAAIVTSVIFAIPHMLENANSILYTVGIGIFFLSLVLCWVRQKTGNIYTGMAIHGLVNLISLLLLINTH